MINLSEKIEQFNQQKRDIAQAFYSGKCVEILLTGEQGEGVSCRGKFLLQRIEENEESQRWPGRNGWVFYYFGLRDSDYLIADAKNETRGIISWSVIGEGELRSRKAERISELRKQIARKQAEIKSLLEQKCGPRNDN